MPQTMPQGVISYPHSDRNTDYLYRVSIKALIRNEQGHVLVVKETGRSCWDLPGGGMDHGEDIRSAIARELAEEVNLNGDFEYSIITTDEPAYLEEQNFWQLRLIFEVTPKNMNFSAGKDADEIAFMSPETFINSASETERLISQYSNQVVRK